MMQKLQAEGELNFSEDFEKLFRAMAKYYDRNPDRNVFSGQKKDPDITRTIDLCDGAYSSTFQIVQDVSTLTSCKLYLDVESVAGTSPTLDIYVYDYLKGKSYYLARFEQFTTGSGQRLIELPQLGQFLRIYAEIGGTSPVMTFKLHLTGKII